ncbi:hypothetical protein SmJEL517_g05897 [Synchytrium microbalum]|uniref:Uncharacterized protein n=1 Tax=Synchytrium microbalum TaxID=1806994 RepID=A0A507BYZ0_9FUNG|nr:uncharacterized protein SmJEL517_g05897 [Synchytrium microbalum]TPX30555.1 hypothetical protein SmJEL517_g05897 [Synchytrium microbalum]
MSNRSVVDALVGSGAVSLQVLNSGNADDAPRIPDQGNNSIQVGQDDIRSMEEGQDLTDLKAGEAPQKKNVMNGDTSPNGRHIEFTTIAEPAMAAPHDVAIPSWSHYNFFYRWTFSFMNELVRRGLKRDLVAEDLPAIDPPDDSTKLVAAFTRAWKYELDKHGPKDANIWKAAFHAFGFGFMLGGLAFVAEACVQIGEAIMLGQILIYFQTPTAPSSDGYLAAMGLSLCVITHGMLHHIEFFLTMRAGMQTRVGMIAVIYAKCLRLYQNYATSGLIVNLVSNDVQRFEDAAPFAHFIWVGPIQAILVLYFAWREISYSAFIGLIVIFAFMPVQGFFGATFGRLRKETVKWRDERIRTISDMISGIQIVKLYAWEKSFEERVNNMRDEETSFIQRANIMRAINEALYFCVGAIIGVFAWTSLWLFGETFTASKIFTTIALFNILRATIFNFFPKAVQFISESMVSMRRIRSFLLLPDIASTALTPESQQFLDSFKPAIIDVAADNASFAWGNPATTAGSDIKVVEDVTRPVTLQNMTFSIERGSLVAVCGSVGSGKSSLISCILGEMEILEGRVGLRSRKIGYSSQTPWIITGSIKDNIVFGRDWNEERFWEVIHACGMSRDIELFANGADTIIGERGVTLSGGQRARVGCARAVYGDADIYFLDSVLEALDVRVGRRLFEDGIKTFLKSKTVFIVTHQLQYIQHCDHVLIMEGGKIVDQGSFQKVCTDGKGKFADALREYEHVEDAVDDNVDDSDNTDVDTAENTKKPIIRKAATPAVKLDDDVRRKLVVAPQSGGNTFGQEMSQEKAASGNVSWSTYYQYFRAGAGVFTGILLFLSLIVGEVAQVMTDWWLSRWVQQSAANQRSPVLPSVYAGLVLLQIILSNARAIAFFTVSLRSTRSIFKTMLNKSLKAPVSFYQLNPLGRVMNRFAKDMGLADEQLPQTFFDFVQSAFILAGVLSLSVAIIPYILIVIPPLIISFVYLSRWYLAASRPVKRLESISRSPVYSSIPSTLEGLPVLRALGATDQFLARFMDIQNNNTRMWLTFLTGARWFGFRIDTMSAMFLVIVSFVAVSLKQSLNLSPGLIGLMLSYSLQLMGLAQWCFRQKAETETLMTSVERILEFTEIPSEAQPGPDDLKPSKEWPQSGHIVLKDLRLTYPQTDNEVLKGISVDIKPGSKVGIVGRTGAGKSSMLQALFRLVEPNPGSVIIDGLSVTDMSLEDIRSRISIIPQEPFCFKGDLRFNLDPFHQYDDARLWEVLDAVELGKMIRNLPGKLDEPVSENGSNFSVGERQLIALARAILRNSKIIVMDEASSNIDSFTDNLIQSAIRRKGGMFSSSTVITIAHRIGTIIDFDELMVLDAGRCVEFGKPLDLLKQRGNSWFGRLVLEMGDDAFDMLYKKAEEKEAYDRML